MINYPKDEYSPRSTTHPLNPPTGSPIPAAYEVDGVLDLDCETCDVPAGRWCEATGGGYLRIPHSSRLARAYRENNPRGREERERRREHLARHRREFVATWGGGRRGK